MNDRKFCGIHSSSLFTFLISHFSFLIFLQTFAYSVEYYELPVNSGFSDKLIQTQYRYVGTIEIPNNRGAKIDSMNRIAGVSVGSPWCASFVVFTSDKSGQIISTKSALAQNHFHYAKKHGRSSSKDRIQAGSLIIWRLGNTSSGHIETILSVVGNNVITIGGNTSAGVGDQRNGDGVFIRMRSLTEPMGSLRVLGVVNFYEQTEIKLTDKRVELLRQLQKNS
jgi:hypothetical protein